MLVKVKVAEGGRATWRRLAPSRPMRGRGRVCRLDTQHARRRRSLPMQVRRRVQTVASGPELAPFGGRAACEVTGARWVNVLLGNVKRAISGSDHAIRQGNYARLCLAVAAYRFNRRFDLRAILPRLARTMMLCKPHPKPVLRMASNFYG